MYRLFSTTVGGERVSNDKIIQSLTNDNTSVTDKQKSINDRFKLIIDNKSIGNFSLAKEYRKEYMGNALLIGLAFLRLCVFRDPESLKIMSKKGNSSD